MHKFALYLMVALMLLTTGALVLPNYLSAIPEAMAAGENERGGHGEEKGPHNGRLLRDGDFSLELAIIENGAPPKFHVYVYEDDKPISPARVQLSIALTRLDGEVNRFNFKPEKDYLAGDGVVSEPHSFDIMVKASFDGKTYKWEFPSYEGRTELSEKAALDSGVKTERAEPGTIREFVRLTGRITLNRNTTAKVRARFPGIVKSVKVNWGEKVKKGQLLAIVESNQSLRSYNITAPVNGIILTRNTNVGDMAGDNPLFIIADLSDVWAEFHIFPRDLGKVKEGQLVRVHTLEGGNEALAHISMMLPTADPLSQTVIAIVTIPNEEVSWRPGMIVQGNVMVSEREVPLRVRTSALQRFRDFTVVFAKFGNTYEARMLELGDKDGEWVEVKGGLKPGTEYVMENSFLIKADIEKSGASHDH